MILPLAKLLKNEDTHSMNTTFRADEPGSFHHVTSRSVDGRSIFTGKDCRMDFVTRLGKLVQDDYLRVHAWVLMSNHFHLLAEVKERGLSESMHRLIGGYAAYFNRVTGRKGHVFQGRFRSIRVERESYLLELIRYIHLNPLRAGIVEKVQDLERYIFSGHAHITGSCNYPWQSIDLLESEFSGAGSDWVSNYLRFLMDGSLESNPEFKTGTYIITRNGLCPVNSCKERLPKQSVRITGSLEYAKRIYSEIYGVRKVRIRNRLEEHSTMERVIKAASDYSGIAIAVLRKPMGPRMASQIRRVVIKIFMDELGISQADTARFLGISDNAVKRQYRSKLSPEALIAKNVIKRAI